MWLVQLRRRGQVWIERSVKHKGWMIPVDRHFSMDKKPTRYELWNVPNTITMCRIAATPYISYLIVTGEYQMALTGLVVAGISDFLDGYIAKNYNQKTVIGSFLDPLADKILIGTISVSLASQALLPVPLVALMFGRDFGLIAGTFWYRYRHKEKDAPFFNTSDVSSFEIAPSYISKINTALQLSLLGISLVNGFSDFPGETSMDILCSTVAGTTIASGADYFYQFLTKSKALSSIKK